MSNRRELPTEMQYKLLSTVRCLAQGSSAFVNPADAEECIDLSCLEPKGQR